MHRKSAKTVHVAMCQTPSKTQTDNETRPLLVMCQGRLSYGWTKRDVSWKFKGEGVKSGINQKIQIQINTFGHPTIRKITRMMSHFKTKMMHQLRFLASVRSSHCSFVSLCLRWSLTVKQKIYQSYYNSLQFARRNTTQKQGGKAQRTGNGYITYRGNVLITGWSGLRSPKDVRPSLLHLEDIPSAGPIPFIFVGHADAQLPR